MRNIDPDILQHFGCSPDAMYWGQPHERMSERIEQSVRTRRMLAVIGSFGTGKSELVRETLSDLRQTDIIYAQSFDKENLRIGHIVASVVDRLSGESPRRDLNARCVQMSRIVGERVIGAGREVVVVIENAHRIHANTLLALKDARESAIYKGHAGLFSVILVGQEALEGKVKKFGEVQYRSRMLRLTPSEGWMTYKERMRYLHTLYSDAMDQELMSDLAALYETPLELDHTIEKKMESARDAGLRQLTSDVVDISIREKRQAADLSLSDVEKATGVPRSTVSDVELGKNSNHETKAKVEQGLQELLNSRKNDEVTA